MLRKFCWHQVLCRSNQLCVSKERIALQKCCLISKKNFRFKLHLQTSQGETFALKSKKADDDARSDNKPNGPCETRFHKKFSKNFITISIRSPKAVVKLWSPWKEEQISKNNSWCCESNVSYSCLCVHTRSWTIGLNSAEKTSIRALLSVRNKDSLLTSSLM